VRKRAAEVEAKLKRLDDAIENGIADVSEPMLDERVIGSKSALRARWWLLRAQKRPVLECPVLCRSGALGEIRTPDPRNRNVACTR
jgi:hypothetical protein